MSLGHLF